VLGTFHVEVFHEINHHDEALTINSFDVDFIGITGEVRRDSVYAVLRLRLFDVAEWR
jgi:hypothetical protein